MSAWAFWPPAGDAPEAGCPPRDCGLPQPAEPAARSSAVRNLPILRTSVFFMMSSFRNRFVRGKFRFESPGYRKSCT
jgi:hypothetical protein